MEKDEVIEALEITRSDVRRVRRFTLLGLVLIVTDVLTSRYLDTHQQIFAGDIDTTCGIPVTTVTAVAGLSWYILSRRARFLNNAVNTDNIYIDGVLITPDHMNATAIVHEPKPTYPPPVDPPGSEKA